MSKMSEIHRELEERASELGYESLQAALDDGYHINYRNKNTVELMRRKGYAEIEKQAVLKDLYALHAQAVEEDRTNDACILTNTIKYIEGE